MTTRITTENITDATIGTADLASSVTLNTQWQTVVTASTLNAVSGRGYFINTTSNTCTVTLPGSPSAGDFVVLKDYARTWNTNNVSLASALFDGVAGQTPSFSTNGQTVTLVYMDGTKGWSLINEDTTTGLGAAFLAATGGTVTTSGDFKIHSFTGDGCFVVSSVGNPAGSNTVDYLVVAGGGGGGGDGGGGGGAGGFRMSNSTCMPAPLTSPLASSCGLPVSGTTYPITVGGGGTAGLYTPPSSGTNGSNSVFSTITSAGGGYGSTFSVNGGNGGSGGGTTRPGSSVRGSGNTPPVSPPQGNNGGGPGPSPNGNGGGGAGAVGQSNPGPSQGGRGGDGSYASTCIAVGCAGVPHTDIPASNPPSVSGAKYFAGGGGGGADQSAPGNYGGLGGGGIGGDRPSPTPGGAGQTNTGGAGGGAGVPGNAGAGGSGIVIIRYKFQ